MKFALILIPLFLFHSFVLAGEADILNVDIKKNGHGYDISVTVLHKDTGWDHFANKWEVVDKDGHVLAERILHHPHVNEQPFIRSLSGVNIADGIESVTVRAHDSVHKYGGKTLTVILPLTTE